MEIRPVEAEFSRRKEDGWTDDQADMMKLIVAFVILPTPPNPKNAIQIIV